ncbi:MAG: hypothetical protein N2A97_04000 [Thermodesulfobacteriales bacterium]
MNRIFVTVLGLLLVAVMISPQSAKAVMGASEPNGVYCEINDVKLFAQTAEDCQKAGGVVTHTVTTTVKPAETSGDNPNQEPEIQRTKDKEPVAP